MRRILIHPEDTTVTCPNCKRHYAVATRQLKNVQSRRLESGRIRYILETVDTHKGHRLHKVETQEGLRLAPGSLITLVWKGRRLVGLSDHNRNLWFNIQPRPAEFPGFVIFYDYMAVIISLCVLLQVLRLVPALGDVYDKYKGGAILITLLVIGLVMALPVLAQKLSDRIDRDKGQGTRLPVFDPSLDD